MKIAKVPEKYKKERNLCYTVPVESVDGTPILGRVESLSATVDKQLRMVEGDTVGINTIIT